MMMFFWLVAAVVILGGGTVAAVWAIRTLNRKQEPLAPIAGQDPAQRELRRRYAAGEIDREEYLQHKVDLEP
jgi:putative membrane protein